MTASYSNHVEITRFLIQNGACVNGQTKVFADNSLFCDDYTQCFHCNVWQQSGVSSLHYACESGNTDIVKLLIQSNANIELDNEVSVG